MIDLQKIPASEAERLAYAEGFTGAAELFARLSDAEATIAALTEELEQVKADLFIAQRERAYGGEA